MKIKYLLTVILLIVSAGFCAAQNGIMIPAGIDGKCGFIDQNGNWVISPQYDEINSLILDDMIQVKVNDKWGFISIADKAVITPQYEEVSFFDDNGTAPVKLNGKWRLIDKTGKTVRETQIEDIKLSYYLSKAKLNGKWGYIDTNYNFVIEPQYEEVGDFENNCAPVKTNGKYGIINTKGEFVIEPKYEEIKGFWGRDSSSIIVKLNGKYGFIDKIGKTIVEPQYDEVDEYSLCNIAIVSQNGKYWIVDKSGTKLTKPLSGIPLIDSFCDLEDTENEIEKNIAARYGLAVMTKKNKYGYIDSTGSFVIKPQFDYASDFFDNDFAEVLYKGKHGWLNKKTYECVYGPKYEGIIINKNIIFVKENNKWGIADEKGNFIVEPKFDWVVMK